MQHGDFAARLNKACDEMKAIVPSAGEGRGVVLSKKLKVSPEAVRKWLSGESRPRVSKMVDLATFLKCDVAWLSLGVDPEMRPADKRFYEKQVEGVTYFALGIAMIEGASCAKPDPFDPRKDFVDFMMIKGGVQAAIRTSLGREIKPNTYEFLVPHEYEQVSNVGFVWHNASRVHMLDLKREMIGEHKETKAGGYVVEVVNKNGVYTTGRDEWPRIKQLGELL